MTFDSKKQRRIMGQFATGVTVVTTDGEAGPHGLTANAVASLSLDPPLVLVAVEKRAHSLELSQRERMLRGQHPAAGPGRDLTPICNTGTKGFHRPEHHHEPAPPAPILTDCLAFVDCRVVEILPGGDHDIFVGEIVAGEYHGGEPLLYYAGGYRRLAE